MSTVVRKNTMESSEATVRKSWFSRHKILSCSILVVLAVVVGGTILAWPILKLRFHSQYVTALNEICKDPTVIERLGQPVGTVRIFPGGNVFTEGDGGTASFNFDVQGPKGIASVDVKSRLLQGVWGFTKIEVAFPDKQRIDLASKFQQGDDTPKFDPNATQQAVREPNLPINIEVNIPGDFSEPKK